jgi:hypothetical protein
MAYKGSDSRWLPYLVMEFEVNQIVLAPLGGDIERAGLHVSCDIVRLTSFITFSRNL